MKLLTIILSRFEYKEKVSKTLRFTVIDYVNYNDSP